MKHEPARHRITTKVWWPWLKRFATAAFFTLVAWLLVTQARAIEWNEVLATLANYPVRTLLVAAALALLSLTLYSSFDLLGRHYTGHTLRARTVMRVTFISYVFNLNMGSLVGGVALRYRLYTRLGLNAGVITRVMTLSMLANWIGYLLLAGVIFGFHAPALPPGWVIGSGGLQVLGFVLLALALLYLLLCAVLRRRSFVLWGHELNLPSLRLAALQLGMGAANWLLMGGIVFVLLQQRIAFPTVASVLLVAAVASVLLVAAVASVIAHVPAGLGVLEAVFIALLSHQLPTHELLAALLAYRLIYYLAPLTLAAVLYLVAETRAKKSAPARRQGSAAADKELE
ncbi:lysylphosphatidylglycerol synthase domain-containing protein [Rhodoferax ferrireducens]|uniref:lysylphosphatidylglycerol synthase domain-containing protein n=1 Tax=Rhodoferax ferrireducens TaxID=192843 RepID=UPI00298DE2B8|nr:lysylphosphatidylglycerol synthase domain-containing protein [Rhodoferax ferrireducens]WPC66404.1 lysylphosphatidylglycerol synthase domain-containing protein [Rhodoferax ferrireducens]